MILDDVLGTNADKSLAVRALSSEGRHLALSCFCISQTANRALTPLIKRGVQVRPPQPRGAPPRALQAAGWGVRLVPRPPLCLFHPHVGHRRGGRQDREPRFIVFGDLNERQLKMIYDKVKIRPATSFREICAWVDQHVRDYTFGVWAAGTKRVMMYGVRA